MGAKYTNLKGLPLSAAVWLAEDTYDHNDDPMTISVTSLMRPTKQLILTSRVPPGSAAATEDVSNMISSKMGTALHDSIERAWINSYAASMVALGYPPGLVSCIKINPTVDELDEDTIAIYMERRTDKKVGAWTISGKFDFVGDGRLEDFKSTSTYSYLKGKNDKKYILQGSIYRWLNQDIITEDMMAITFIFTDWVANQAMSNPNYPQTKVMEYPLHLLSLAETEAYVKRKIDHLEAYKDAPESEMPECTDEDLWRSDPVWKYYKNPASAAKKGGRSTKNFDNQLEAQMKFTEDGSVGVVKEIKGEVKACKYCSAFSECKQKDSYIAAGTLKI